MQNARNISLQPITTRATTSAEIKQLGLPLITFEKDLPRMDEPDALTPRAWPPWTVCVRWWCSSGRFYGTVYLTVRGLSVILPMTILSLKEHRFTDLMRGRTCQHSPPSRSHSARRALYDREGSA